MKALAFYFLALYCLNKMLRELWSESDKQYQLGYLDGIKANNTIVKMQSAVSKSLALDDA